MQNTIKRKNVSLLFLLAVCVIVLLFSDFGKKERIIVYDCDKIFLYKDIPMEVVNECRKMTDEKRLTVNLNNVTIT